MQHNNHGYGCLMTTSLERSGMAVLTIANAHMYILMKLLQPIYCSLLNGGDKHDFPSLL